MNRRKFHPFNLSPFQRNPICCVSSVDCGITCISISRIAGPIQPLSLLVKKYATATWRPEHQVAFCSVMKSIDSAPVLVLHDDSKTFHVLGDAIDFSIGCALIQFDDDGRERVVSYQSRQLTNDDKIISFTTRSC